MLKETNYSFLSHRIQKGMAQSKPSPDNENFGLGSTSYNRLWILYFDTQLNVNLKMY